MTIKLVVQEKPAMYKVLLEQTRVQALSKVVSKLVDGSHNPPAKQSTGHPMLSARNIDNSTINFDEFRFISNEDFAQEDRRTRVTAGDVLLTIVGTIGRVAVVPEAAAPFALQRSVAVMTPTTLLSKYLAYQLQAPDVQRYFEQNARGTAQKGVYLKTLGNTPVLVPGRAAQKQTIAYLDEQLSRLDASVAALHRVQANLKRYRASVLKSACEGRLVPTEAELARAGGRTFETGAEVLQRILAERRSAWSGKGKFKEPSDPNAEFCPEVPEGWATASIDQTGEVTTGFTPPTSDSRNFGGSIPFFKPTDLDAGYNTHDAREWLTDKGASAGRLLPMGSVLVTCIGATIGKTGLARVDCATNQQINAVTTHESGVLAEYLFFAVCSPVGQKAIRSNASSTTLPILNKSKFAGLTIPLPPLAEQHRIVAEADRRLSLIRVAEAQVAANLARAKRLRQSILQAAFAHPGSAGQ